MPLEFRIKVCGITSVDDALATAEAGADAIGLNFYAASKRRIELDVAERIVQALPPHVVKVGLFVDAPGSEVIATATRLGLDLIQLHGREPPEYVAQLSAQVSGPPVMRAFASGAAGQRPAIEYLAACDRLSARPRLVLFDADVAGQVGGTGHTANWDAAAEYGALAAMPKLVLAGGLTPDNVGAAIRRVRPAGVDVASGVESRPGQKDAAKVERFVAAARAAFRDVFGDD